MNSIISLKVDNLDFSAYFCSKDESGRFPGLIVIHEVWGLKDHIKNVAERFANQGYQVLAPDLLSETGITQKIDQSILKQVQDPSTKDEAQKRMREAMTPLQSPQFGVDTVKKLKKCVTFLLEDKKSNGDVAVVGFCFGGTYSWALAVNDSRIKASIPFYGHAPKAEEELKSINCPVLAFYGQKDTRLMDELPQLEEKMGRLKKNFQCVVYPQTGHAFFNDTNPTTFNPEATVDSWKKTLDFLKQVME